MESPRVYLIQSATHPHLTAFDLLLWWRIKPILILNIYNLTCLISHWLFVPILQKLPTKDPYTCNSYEKCPWSVKTCNAAEWWNKTHYFTFLAQILCKSCVKWSPRTGMRIFLERRGTYRSITRYTCDLLSYISRNSTIFGCLILKNTKENCKEVLRITLGL